MITSLALPSREERDKVIGLLKKVIKFMVLKTSYQHNRLSDVFEFGDNNYGIKKWLNHICQLPWTVSEEVGHILYFNPLNEGFFLTAAAITLKSCACTLINISVSIILVQKTESQVDALGTEH